MKNQILYGYADALLPGCGHGVAQSLIAEVINELGIQDKTIGVAPVGCSVFAYNYLNIDMTEAAHGRASQ
jgi:2-oxoglutarate ferredoxin oxidoreductase subunit beta